MVIVISALLFDVISGSTKVVRGKIVTIQGRTIYVLNDRKKLKKYRIFEKEVLERLAPEQKVELKITKLTNYAAHLQLIDHQAEQDKQ